MTPTRLLTALIQPVLVLLLLAGVLLAGVPVAESDRAAGSGPRMQAAERLFPPAESLHLKAGEGRDEASARAERWDGDDTPEAILAAVAVDPLDRARLIWIGCDSYATAPPRHRPCAAPPTGPPLA